MSDLPPDSAGPTPPNAAVRMLVDELGYESTRELVEIYLKEFVRLSAELASGDCRRQRFAAHSLKSSAHHMGATGLAELMDALENQLTEPDATPLSAEELARVAQEFDVNSESLRAFVKG